MILTEKGHMTSIWDKTYVWDRYMSDRPTYLNIIWLSHIHAIENGGAKAICMECENPI